mmetsp:Transcript_52007/g.118527  ORF Transcript_52007/g.118527 Transcript_52007/m.118527 type:complete len:281 (-) Transcript_52007:342-1184(-)
MRFRVPWSSEAQVWSLEAFFLKLGSVRDWAVIRTVSNLLAESGRSCCGAVRRASKKLNTTASMVSSSVLAAVSSPGATRPSSNSSCSGLMATEGSILAQNSGSSTATSACFALEEAKKDVLVTTCRPLTGLLPNCPSFLPPKAASSDLGLLFFSALAGVNPLACPSFRLESQLSVFSRFSSTIFLDREVKMSSMSSSQKRVFSSSCIKAYAPRRRSTSISAASTLEPSSGTNPSSAVCGLEGSLVSELKSWVLKMACSSPSFLEARANISPSKVWRVTSR